MRPGLTWPWRRMRGSGPACRSPADFPRRGRGRDEIRPGLRSIPCARAFIVFYAIDENEVQIIRVLHARREIATAFEDE